MNELIRQLLGWKQAAQEQDAYWNPQQPEPEAPIVPPATGRTPPPEPIPPEQLGPTRSYEERFEEWKMNERARREAEAERQRKAKAGAKEEAKPKKSWLKYNLQDLFG